MGANEVRVLPPLLGIRVVLALRFILSQNEKKEGLPTHQENMDEERALDGVFLRSVQSTAARSRTATKTYLDFDVCDPFVVLLTICSIRSRLGGFGCGRFGFG